MGFLIILQNMESEFTVVANNLVHIYILVNY